MLGVGHGPLHSSGSPTSGTSRRNRNIGNESPSSIASSIQRTFPRQRNNRSHASLHGPDISRRWFDPLRIRLLRCQSVFNTEQSAVLGNCFAEFGRCLLYPGEFQSGEESDQEVRVESTSIGLSLSLLGIFRSIPIWKLNSSLSSSKTYLITLKGWCVCNCSWLFVFADSSLDMRSRRRSSR
jgi:hypothetical protein